ncbi:MULTISPECIES: GDP-L-fucose synthase family protein [unclassified Prochlorococcus]|uniref:GDP-L-fucose synthase family protein n=1 Tax=unclassified Prochlorococcus TaxID=2627481 RepID=UPI00053383D1|nr:MULTISPECIES: GDP-L-fucose synthase [unclassified Prochlorococcus]KGG16890.1 GDP-L-fucose synthetase [Prochlorococcus sp. MIT 0602]KGG18135.1 GDP-L-fucose synthetase [Prochlorococcus sp. MIT 0603]
MISNGLIKKEDKIFVAGHKGMAGSAICRSLLNNGFENILTIDRNQLDLTDFNKVRSWFSNHQPTIVILAAAKVGGIEANRSYPVDFILDNMKIQNNVIENSWKNNVRRFLFLGSSCIYPKSAPQPIKEESLLTSSLEATNEWYAIAKISGLKLCQALRQQYGFDAITLMPTNLYGPGDNYHIQNSHVLPAFIRRFYEAKNNGDSIIECWGSGSPYREFLHVDDLGSACLFALNHWDPQSLNAPIDSYGKPLNFLNVGTGVDIRISDLAQAVAKAVGYLGEIKWDRTKPDGTLKKQLDVANLSNLGWKSSISLDEGLISTILDFKEQFKNKNVRF